MAREKSSTVGAAPRPLAERAIIETLEQAESPAEGVTEVDPDLRREMVATAAYFIAEQRGFLPGHEQEDWLQAEAAIDQHLPKVLAGD